MLRLMTVTQFAVRTSHRTYLSVDPAKGTLRHTASGPDGNRVLAHWHGEDSCVLTRRDGGPLSVAVAGADLTAPLLPCRLITDADRSRVAFRHIEGPLLTALPDGQVMHDRTLIADWELFTLEPDGGKRPPISAAFANDDAFDAYCLDPEHDLYAVACLLALLPQERRRVLLPKLAVRTDYDRIFATLRRVLSGGLERSAQNTRAHLRQGIDAHGWAIGDHSYGKPTIVGGAFGRLEIGRYCAIADDARIVLAEPSAASVTNYPFGALHQFWPSAPDHASARDAGSVVIGNSVWIGEGVTLLPGADIGDGAIIGAATIVSKPVPPFAVVAGNPTRVRSSRFDKSVVARLLALRWWDWPDEKVDRFMPLLLGDRIEAFLDQAERER